MNKSGWSFAIVNGKLSEIFFDKKGKEVTFLGYCNVRESEYKTKKEKKRIETDTDKIKLKYIKGEYTWLNKPTGIIVKTGKIKT